MLKKKMCLLGDFGVGKTSLIRRFVHSVYSEEYLSTIGCVISKKDVRLISGEDMTLIIWDLEGRDDVTLFKDTYLNGVAGYFLVADGTRAGTLTSARNINTFMQKNFRKVPSLLLLNKADLKNDWVLTPSDYKDLEDQQLKILQTSAKTGNSVDEAFHYISEAMAKN